MHIPINNPRGASNFSIAPVSYHQTFVGRGFEPRCVRTILSSTLVPVNLRINLRYIAPHLLSGIVFSLFDSCYQLALDLESFEVKPRSANTLTFLTWHSM